MSADLIHLYHAAGSSAYSTIHAALLRHGVALRLHQTDRTLRETLAQPPASQESRLVVLAGPPTPCLDLAAQLRSADPSVALMTLLSTVSHETLLRAMRSGVDACWHDLAPARLIVAAVLRLLRATSPRSGAVSREDATGLRFASRGWVVVGPGGASATLTTAERAILLALSKAEQRRLSHAALFDAIDQVAPVSNRTTASRRLSVLISRLRHKFRAAGLAMPIRSVRSMGYELCAEIDEAK